MFENLLAWFLIEGLVVLVVKPPKSGASRKPIRYLGTDLSNAIFTIPLLSVTAHGH